MTYIVGSAHYEYDGDHDGANSIKPKYNLPTSEIGIKFSYDTNPSADQGFLDRSFVPMIPYETNI